LGGRGLKKKDKQRTPLPQNIIGVARPNAGGGVAKKRGGRKKTIKLGDDNSLET